MPHCQHSYSLSTCLIDHDVRGAPDYQFPCPWFGTLLAKVWVASQCSHYAHDPRCESSCRFRLVDSDVLSNLVEPRQRLSRPYNLKFASQLVSRAAAHAASLSWRFPQAHLGSGNSWSVPHESSHAFMSSSLM